MNDFQDIDSLLKTMPMIQTKVGDGCRSHFLEVRKLMTEHPYSAELGAAILAVVTGRNVEWIRLHDDFKVGRHKSVDLALPKDWVSNFHCRFSSDSDGWTLEDLDSTNGTFVNGQRINKRCLCLGDVIDLGSAKLIFYRNEA